MDTKTARPPEIDAGRIEDLCFASFRLKIGEESLGNLHNYTWDNYISQITKGIALIKIQGPLCTLTIE